MISGEEKINSNKAAKYQEKKKGSKIIFRSKILGVVVCNVYHLTLDLIYISIDARADIVLGKYMENNKKKKKRDVPTQKVCKRIIRKFVLQFTTNRILQEIREIIV